MEDRILINPRLDPKGCLKLWKMPNRSKRYIIPADVSEGLEGGNYSAAHVIDVERFEQVGVWHGLEEPYQFGRILFNLGEFFNGALLIPERNNNGISVIDYLRSNGYPNIYRMQKFDYILAEDTERLGWMTNAHTRPLIIDSLKEAVRTNSLLINDPETLSEMRTFVRNPKTGKIEAAGGSRDDLVISLAIGCYVRSVTPFENFNPEMEISYIDRVRTQNELHAPRGGFNSSGY